MRFIHDDGSWTAWSQYHVGEVIEKVNGRWVSKGKCLVCGGKATEPCPACRGRTFCQRCSGEGRVRRYFP